jgi:hypothetical protein
MSTRRICKPPLMISWLNQDAGQQHYPETVRTGRREGRVPGALRLIASRDKCEEASSLTRPPHLPLSRS